MMRKIRAIKKMMRAIAVVTVILSVKNRTE